MADNKIEFIELLQANGDPLVDYVLAGGASIETGEIPLESFNPNGMFTMFVNVNGGGAGAVTIKPITSITGAEEDYAQSNDYPAVEDFKATDGPEANGKINAAVVLSVCRRVKFKLTNTDEANAITLKKLVFGWQ